MIILCAGNILSEKISYGDYCHKVNIRVIILSLGTNYNNIVTENKSS